MQNQIKRVCRVCGLEYAGYGVLCPTHAAELAAQNAAAALAATAALTAREMRESAERQARRRTEWKECV